MTRSNISKLKPIDPEIERTFCSLRKLVKDKIDTVKVEPMQEQHGINAQAGAAIRVGVRVGAGEGVRARVVQNVQRSLMDYVQPSLSGINHLLQGQPFKPTTLN